MFRMPSTDATQLDRVSLVTGALGVVAHGAMMVLDAALVATSAELLSSGDPSATPLALTLTAVVMLHLVVLAWAGRRVVDFLEIATDDTLPRFTRRSRARHAARLAGTTLLFSGAMAPVVALLLAVLPAIGTTVGPFAAL